MYLEFPSIFFFLQLFVCDRSSRMCCTFFKGKNDEHIIVVVSPFLLYCWEGVILRDEEYFPLPLRIHLARSKSKLIIYLTNCE